MNDPQRILTSMVRETILQQRGFGAAVPLGNALLESVDLNIIPRIITGELDFQMRFLLQSEVASSHTHRESTIISAHREVQVWTPATTWQMFKSTHAHSWWLRRLVRRRGIRMVEHRRHVHMHREVTLETQCTEWATYPSSDYEPLPPQYFGQPVIKIERDSFVDEKDVR